MGHRLRIQREHTAGLQSSNEILSPPSGLPWMHQKRTLSHVIFLEADRKITGGWRKTKWKLFLVQITVIILCWCTSDVWKSPYFNLCLMYLIVKWLVWYMKSQMCIITETASLSQQDFYSSFWKTEIFNTSNFIQSTNLT